MRTVGLSFLIFLTTFPFLSGASGSVTFSGQDIVTAASVQLATSEASKGIVVVFLSAVCPCSASHELRLKELAAEFSASFKFLAIHSNSDEPAELTKKHFQETAFGFSVIQDDQAKMASQLGAFKTPHAFILNPQGEVLFKGGVDDSHIASHAKKFYLREALLAVNQGEKPSTKEVRVLGCVIKRP